MNKVEVVKASSYLGKPVKEVVKHVYTSPFALINPMPIPTGAKTLVSEQKPSIGGIFNYFG